MHLFCVILFGFMILNAEILFPSHFQFAIWKLHKIRICVTHIGVTHESMPFEYEAVNIEFYAVTICLSGSIQFSVWSDFQWSDFYALAFDDSSFNTKDNAHKLYTCGWMKKKKKPTTTTTFQCQTADTYQSQSNSHFPNRISVLNKHDSCSDQMLCSQRTEIMLKCIKKAILRTQSVSNGLRTWTVNRTSVCYSHRIHNAIHFNLYMLIYRRELTSVLFCVCVWRQNTKKRMRDTRQRKWN